MKEKRVIAILLMLTLMMGSLQGCSKKETPVPELTQVRSICNLATLKCYYHNVALSEKKAAHLFEKDKKFWIEYTGVANVGIDMSKVQMKVDGEKVKVTIPSAKLLNISIEEEDLNENSFFFSSDGLNKNEITADDQTKAINDAQEEMKKEVRENTAVMASAQNRAKTLIENYIKQLGEASGTEYQIEWNYIEDKDEPENTEG